MRQPCSEVDPAALRVLERFGFPPSAVDSVEALVTGTGGHATYRVRTQTRGDWVLKRYAAAADRQALRHTHQLEQRLEQSGFPVAPLLPATSGQTLLESQGAAWSVHGWVEGRQFTVQDRDDLVGQDDALVSHLGSALGTLHRTSRGLPQPPAPAVDPTRLLAAPRHAVRALRRPRLRPPGPPRWLALRLRRDKSEFDRWVLQVLPEIAARARRLAAQPLPVGPEGVGLIHHDLNWSNLIFDEDRRLQALIDFDNATVAPWVLEVGSAAVVLAGRDPLRVERFVDAYETEAALPVDRAQVALAMEMKCVQSILNTVVTYLAGQTDLSERGPWCRDLYASLESLDAWGR